MAGQIPGHACEHPIHFPAITLGRKACWPRDVAKDLIEGRCLQCLSCSSGMTYRIRHRNR